MRLDGGRLFPGWIFCTGLMICGGCGGKSDAPSAVTVYEVKGSVLLADGKPLSGGHVYLVPKEGLVAPEGAIKPDGTFTVATSGSGEGAPPGEYKVRLEPADATLLSGKKTVSAGKKLPFSAKYLDEDTSGLTTIVKAEPNTLEPFRLK